MPGSPDVRVGDQGVGDQTRGPLEFIPVLASRPASTTVTKSGPGILVHLEHDQVSAACRSQSQFCPISVGPSALRPA